MVVRRVEALGKFLDTDDGKNLLAGTKRASNILSHRGEKGQAQGFDGAPDASLYKLDEEKALAKAIDQVKAEAGTAVAKEDFAGAMSAMAKLRPAVDAFFDKVKVNDDDAEGAREPAEAAERNSRGDARGGGFFEDTGLSLRSPDAAQHEAVRCRAGVHAGRSGSGSAEQRCTLHRVRDTRESHKKKPRSGGGKPGGAFLSGRCSRTSACAAPGLIVQVATPAA